MAALATQILVEDDDGLDSAYGGEDSASETATLQSSFRQYIYANGRRYNSYQAGNIGGNLFISPIGDRPQRVLDLGTGTGIWAIEFADQYPSASVVGNDLSPIQPTLIPPNLQFEVDDFELEWTYRKESFDFIHARALYGSVSDYRALYQRVLEHLKPGGWFEETEVGVVPLSDDDTIRGTTLQDWGDLSLTAGDRFGRTLRIVDLTKDLMEEAGFINVTLKKYKWPIGPWPKDPKLKEIGLYNRVNWEEGMEGWLMFLFTTYHGWTPDEVRVYIAKTRQYLRSKTVHAYQMVSFCCGQKPTPPATAEE